MTTPENITELKENEIFVFGSNKKGHHAGGAAKTAVEKFGAIEGQGEGLQGQSYAIPTMGTMKKLSEGVTRFLVFAEKNKDKKFFVTKIGCGIAGKNEKNIKKLFENKSVNVILPKGWATIRGFKAFNIGLKCRGFQYEFGKDFYHDGEISLCNSGFHFCKSLGDVYNYYSFGTDIEVCEVESDGDVIDEENGEKSVTNHLRLVRKLNADESSNNNGVNNIGHSNTGHWNTGDRNTGHSNTGHRNTGDWNTSSFHTGSFNTKDVEEILIFNKTFKKSVWDKISKPSCLYFNTKEWIEFSEMTEEETKENPACKTAGGYLKTIPYKEAFTKSMQNASKEEIQQVKKLPNFDADVFEEISGFRID